MILKRYLKILYYLLRILDILGFLSKFNFVIKFNLYNNYLKIPIIRNVGISNLTSTESWLFNLLNKLLTRKNYLFIDVGVNIGQTLIKVKSINRDINYIGFEPNINCVFYLNNLVKINNFNKTLVFPVGLGSNNGFELLHADKECATGATMVKNFRINHNTPYVYNLPVFKLDDISLNFEMPFLIKIDVEGFELDVFKGMQNIFKFKPLIICEILPVYDKNSPNGIMRWERQLQIQDILKCNNYNIFLIDEKNGLLNHLDKFFIHSNMYQTNYLFCHNSEFELLNSFKF